MEISMQELKEIMGKGNQMQPCNAEHPFTPGMKIFARTVTFHVTGEITEINGHWATLKDAAWVADSGRFADALKTCNFNEVEPYQKEVFLNLETVTDATIIDELPKDQK